MNKPFSDILFRWRKRLLSSFGPTRVLPSTKRRPAVRVADCPVRLVLSALANYMDADGSNAFPSQETLARDSGFTVRTVKAALQRAEKGGWIERARVPIRHREYMRYRYTYVPRFPIIDEGESGSRERSSPESGSREAEVALSEPDGGPDERSSHDVGNDATNDPVTAPVRKNYLLNEMSGRPAASAGARSNGEAAGLPEASAVAPAGSTGGPTSTEISKAARAAPVAAAVAPTADVATEPRRSLLAAPGDANGIPVSQDAAELRDKAKVLRRRAEDAMVGFVNNPGRAKSFLGKMKSFYGEDLLTVAISEYLKKAPMIAGKQIDPKDFIFWRVRELAGRPVMLEGAPIRIP